MSTQEETEELRGHAEDSDGIEELDNELPRWWVGLFLITVVWGVWLMLDWHVFNSKSLSAQYVARMESFGLNTPPDLSGIAIAMDDATIAEGQKVYATNCAVCHEADGSGNIGPSLIDDEWRYDHHVEGILESIAMGRPAGMPGWLAPLGEEKVASVTAYVASLTDAPFLDSAGDDVAVEGQAVEANEQPAAAEEGAGDDADRPGAFPEETEHQQEVLGGDGQNADDGATNDHSDEAGSGVDAQP